MAVTVEAFAEYVGEDYATSERQADLTRALSVASALVDAELTHARRQMPVQVRDQVVLDTAYAVYRRNENNSGDYSETAPLRAPNDPLQQSRPILRKYVMSV